MSLKPEHFFHYFLDNPTVVNEYKLLAFDINRHLSRWFSDPRAFRSLQAKTGALISGSSAIQFLDRTVYEGSDLDLFVERQSTLVVGEWLLKEGYEYVVGRDGTPSFEGSFQISREPGELGTEIPGVFTFEKPGMKVQIVTAVSQTLAVILNFHSTCVMNIITATHAYSFYPHATFEDRTALALVQSTSEIGYESTGEVHALAYDLAIDKYRSRGWTMVENATPSHHKRFFINPNRLCSVGDEHCWVMPLSQDDVGKATEMERLVPIPQNIKVRRRGSAINSWVIRNRLVIRAFIPSIPMVID